MLCKHIFCYNVDWGSTLESTATPLIHSDIRGPLFTSRLFLGSIHSCVVSHLLPLSNCYKGKRAGRLWFLTIAAAVITFGI